MNNQKNPVIEIATDSSIRLSEIKQRRFYVSDKPRDPNTPYVRARFQRKAQEEQKKQCDKKRTERYTLNSEL